MSKLNPLCLVFLVVLLVSTHGVAQEKGPALASKAQRVAALNAVGSNSAERTRLLVQLVETCWRKCAEDAKLYGEEALSLLDEFPYLTLETQLLIYLPRAYQRSAQYNEAKQLIDRGLVAAKKLGDAKALASIQFNQAVGFANAKQFILAEKAYQALFETYRSLNHIDGMGSALNNMGRINLRTYDYGKALKHYQEALAIYQTQTNNPNTTANAANTMASIGEIYRITGDYKTAEEVISKALKLIDGESYPGILNSINTRLSDLYIETQQYDKASELVMEALVKAKAFDITISEERFYGKLIEIALAQQDLPLATQYHKDSVARFPQAATAELTLARAQYQIAHNRLDLAADLLSPIVTKIESGDVSDNAMKLLNKLIAVKQKQALWQESANLLALQNEKYREQEKLNQQSRLAQFEILYKATEKEKKIVELEQQNNLKSIEIITAQASRKQVILVSMLVALVLFVVIYLGMQKRKMLALRAKLLQDNAERKTRLFSDISHELRTPLSVLKLQLEGLEYDLVDDPKQTYALLHDKLASINLLISDISQLAQADAGKLGLMIEPVEIKPFFEQWCFNASSAANQAGLLFSFDIEIEDGAICQFDASRIKQVLNNLLSNCCRYTDAPGQIQLSVYMNSSELRLQLFDSEPGLNDDQLDQIFERLYRADKSRSRKLGGSGLGLTICKSLVEAHKGTIRAKQSTLGGMRISIRLPLTQKRKIHD